METSGRRRAGSTRVLLVILVMTIAEVAWALLCAKTQANLGLFYLGLVGASAVFFLVPGLVERK